MQLLAEAFRRRKLPVEVKVLINDAPGVMAAGRYMNSTTMIGVILGTGEYHVLLLAERTGGSGTWGLLSVTVPCLLFCCSASRGHTKRVAVECSPAMIAECPSLCAGTNACYAEQVSRIQKLPANYQPRTEEMCINTEWGAFNADCLPLMEEDRCSPSTGPWSSADVCPIRDVWDTLRCFPSSRLSAALGHCRDLDAESVNPEQAIFEKLVSGLYLGEVRQLASCNCSQSHRIWTAPTRTGCYEGS